MHSVTHFIQRAGWFALGVGYTLAMGALPTRRSLEPDVGTREPQPPPSGSIVHDADDRPERVHAAGL